MNEKNRKVLIIITAILLVLLVTVGIIMLLNQPSGKKDNETDKNKKENNRCVEQLCINKVTTDDTNGDGINITLKNEGVTIIKEACVKLVSETNSIELCVNELDPEGEMMQIFNKKEMGGDKIEDFSLEKVEKKTTEE